LPIEAHDLNSFQKGDGRRRPVADVAPGSPIDFNRHIRPILSEYCYGCHGPSDDGRKADLRLDNAEGLRGESGSGKPVVAPRDPSGSELIRRIEKTGAGRMPPRSFGKAPTAAEIVLLRRWIGEGAAYSSHWAYLPPVAVSPPKPKGAAWVRNPIDAFILDRLERQGLAPSPEANRRALIRRVSLGLTGLPPTPSEVEAFVRDQSADAYERLVDRLLASPAYGEQMASPWLDLARYADTHGGTVDTGREMWMYRDWVIRALNANMPFDRFTIEQLAGDLLPNSTVDQKIATGFLRNEAVQSEICKDELAASLLVDRVNTVASTWLGSTVGCAQCHDHKYDPVSQRDFYRLAAFFNTIIRHLDRDPRGNDRPVLRLPTAEQEAQLQAVRRQAGEFDRKKASGLAAAIGILPVGAEHRRFLTASAAIEKQVVTAMVIADSPKLMETHVLIRGNFDRQGEKVDPGVPGFLPPLPTDRSPNRLDLARWLVAPNHPLTARVVVNRIWALHFGTSLVATREDFGSQGEPPTHPALLDWLAVKFVSSGWNVKQLHRLIVTSAAYRQSSAASEQLRAADPENRLYARGPRYRLRAETIRDSMLAIAGLLDRKMGGPGVRPYQPAGLWEAIRHTGDFTAQTYVQGHGADLYRRGVYLFWKRTLPHPSMTLLDAPTRAVCAARRPRTNTALQALLLLNDITAVECARSTALRMAREGGADLESRLRYGFLLCTARQPNSGELAALKKLYDAELERFREDPAAAAALLHVGESPSAEEFDAAELAALSMAARVLLNLDETISLE